MSIKDQLNAKLKNAMKAKDQQTLNFVRMLKAKMTEKTTSKGFSGEVDDALWLGIIASYAKGQKKALEARVVELKNKCEAIERREVQQANRERVSSPPKRLTVVKILPS